MRLKNVIHASTYIRGYLMLTLYIADAERDAGMKNLSRKEALEILNGMKVKNKIPKAAVMQNKRNAALDMAIEALKYSEIPNSSTGCISRQAVVKFFNDWISCLDENCHHQSVADMIIIKNDFKNLPSVQPEPRWIPVTERLPENDNEVLITIWDAEDDYVEVYKGFYQGHEWWTQWCHGCSKIKDEPCGENIVIAWMPLPEPYRGGDSE